MSVYDAVMAVQFAPQNISVQNNIKWCIRSHAPPSSLVPFDPRRNKKFMRRFSEVWREAFPGWWWSACCQSGAEQQSHPSSLILGSERSVNWWIQWSNSSLGRIAFFFQLPSKAEERKNGRMKIGTVGKTQQTARSSPVWGGSSHGQRGDGADGLRVRVSP